MKYDVVPAIVPELLGAGFDPWTARKVDYLYDKYPTVFMGVEPVTIGMALLGLGSSIAGFFGKKKGADAAKAAAEVERLRMERAEMERKQLMQAIGLGAAIIVPTAIIITVIATKKRKTRG